VVHPTRLADHGVTIPVDADRFTVGYSANPTAQRSRTIGAKYARLAAGHARVYVLVAAWVIACTIFHLYFARSAFSNDLIWLQYYAVNYEYGFVRRGLAGELLRLFPSGHYFAATYTVLWASIVVWLIALVALSWQILSTGARSERRIMLALVVPVLPFAVSYAAYSPHPELFAMTALLAFGISLTRARTRRSRMILSALYGLFIAVLALVHEAIPLELALGAVLAIVVLSNDATRSAQRICAALAVGPGIVVVLLIAAVRRLDVAQQLCAQVPHGMIGNPFAVATTPQKALDYMLGRIESRLDYHDWVCHHVAPTFNEGLTTAVGTVFAWGFVPLLGAFVLGLLYFVGTTWVIRYFSGVSVRTFLDQFRGNLLLPVLASLLLVPLFMTGVDWTRWWILITCDVATVYILYAIHTREIEQAPSRRNLAVFVCAVIVLAVIPTGAANNVGTNTQPPAIAGASTTPASPANH
jgi:hypothetical protein